MSEPIRVVVVEDEPPSRARLRRLLESESDVRVVAECASGAEALVALRAHRPDAVFLDLHLGDRFGLDVLDELEPESRPLVVLVTAFDRYAVDAFARETLDYVLKPYDAERLRLSVARVRERLTAGVKAEEWSRLMALVRELRERADGTGSGPHLAVRQGAETLLVPLAEIDWLEAADNYVEVHVGGRTHLVRETLTALEQRLDGRRFVRIHRRFVVNLERVRAIRSTVTGSGRVVLHDGTALKLGRSYRAALADRVHE